MANARPPDLKPEHGKAVVELWRAEREFTQAYSSWLLAPGEQERERRSELDEWERRIEEAQHEVQKWQAVARSAGLLGRDP